MGEPEGGASRGRRPGRPAAQQTSLRERSPQHRELETNAKLAGGHKTGGAERELQAQFRFPSKGGNLALRGQFSVTGAI